MSISVVYWSGTGNTQAMAEAVAEGIKAAGQEAELLEVGNADAATVAAGNAFALGCPSMGSEQLEEAEMEPLLRRSSHWYQERQSSCSVLMAGAMENGCVTGQNA